MQAPRQVRCMHGDHAEGGTALVHWLPESAPLAAVESTAAANDTQVFVTRNAAAATANDAYRVESYSAAGRRIQFCGHGALSAAHVAFDELDAATLRFANLEQHWQARRADAEHITLIYSRASAVPRITDCAVPAFLADALGAEVVAAANVGGPTDYLIAEIATGVAALQPDFPALMAATERALIVTARSDADCMYRYFAPQYGTPEDAATGSAAAQLAAYWAPRLGLSTFTARQMSAQGACLLLGCHGDVIELTARVAYR